MVKRFLGAVGADTVLGLAISTEDLPGRGVGATAECTLPVHGAGGVRPRQRERGLARGYEQVEPLAGWGGARRRNLQRLADLSKPFGTKLEIKGGTAEIKVKAGN